MNIESMLQLRLNVDLLGPDRLCSILAIRLTALVPVTHGCLVIVVKVEFVIILHHKVSLGIQMARSMAHESKKACHLRRLSWVFKISSSWSPLSSMNL